MFQINLKLPFPATLNSQQLICYIKTNLQHNGQKEKRQK